MSVSDPALSGMLKKRGVKVVIIPETGDKVEWIKAHADAVLKDVLSGKRTALLTYGHPVFLCGLWDHLRPLLRAGRIKCAVEEGVSSLDRLIRSCGLFSVPPEGLSILSAISMKAENNAPLPRSPFFLFDAGVFRDPGRKRQAGAFFGALISMYGPAHTVWALEVPCFQDPAGRALKFRLEDHLGAVRRFNERTTLYIPAYGAGEVEPDLYKPE